MALAHMQMAVQALEAFSMAGGGEGGVGGWREGWREGWRGLWGGEGVEEGEAWEVRMVEDEKE